MSDSSHVDPITLEVIQASMINTVREMRSIITRSSYTPTLCEGVDFSCGIISSSAELVAMSEDTPLHIFAVAWHVKLAREKYGDDINPGDLLWCNDPYTSGPHLNDMLFLRPVFVEGKLTLMLAARTHWTDVGGKSPGSLVGQAREIYEEGVRVPMIKIYKKGKLNKDLRDTLLANMRNPEEREGDIQATLGALTTGESRIGELYERYTLPVVERCVETILNRSERVVREAVGNLPDGHYAYEEYLENTGVENEPMHLKCKMTIDSDQIIFDFTGSDPQVEGPMNGGPSMTFTAVFIIIKSYLEPETPVNGGVMRAISCITPKGTFLNARRPAPVGGYAEVGMLVQHTTIGLLSQILPGKVAPAPVPGANHTYLAGWDEAQQKHWIWYEYPWGGWPASIYHDGTNVADTYDQGDMTSTLPTERAERDNPVRVIKCDLWTDSGGPGYHRGGLGFVKEVEVLDPKGCVHSNLSEEAVIPRLGTYGGYPGGMNVFRIRREGREIIPGDLPSKIANFPLESGDVLIMRVRGGGGFGDPLKREVERVHRDVVAGYVSEDKARDSYGVILQDGEPDLPATRALRAEKVAARQHLTIQENASDEYDSLRRRLCRINTATAQQLGVGEGSIIEYVPKDSAHLKAWVRIDDSIPADQTPIGPQARTILKVEAGSALWVRPLSPSV